MTDQDFLRKAVEVGNQVDKPYNFGAVVVNDGKLISAEHAHVFEENDPSRHSEVSAITAACKKLGSFHIDGAVLYSSHEPCTMCLSCAAWANISRIVYVTPASAQKGMMYEFKKPDIQSLAKELAQPMSVEQVSLD